MSRRVEQINIKCSTVSVNHLVCFHFPAHGLIGFSDSCFHYFQSLIRWNKHTYKHRHNTSFIVQQPRAFIVYSCRRELPCLHLYYTHVHWVTSFQKTVTLTFQMSKSGTQIDKTIASCGTRNIYVSFVFT